MNISFDGIGEVVATFLVEEDGKVKGGDVVCISGDGEVGLGSSGEQLCGVALGVSEDGYAAVQIDGLVRVNYSGTEELEAGWNMLCADGAGGVTTAAENGIAYLVVAADPEAKTAVLKL